MRWDLEELARHTLESQDLGPPIDPDILADRLGLEVLDGGPFCEGLLVGRKVYVSEDLRQVRRAFAIAHETAHYLLRRAGLPDNEPVANYLASALLLPRDDFGRDLRRLGWDLIALRAVHPFASFEAIARRIVALEGARVFVFDKPLTGGRSPRWYSVPWGHRPAADERLAAREAAHFGAPVDVRAGLTGWPVIQADWIRVITVTAL